MRERGRRAFMARVQTGIERGRRSGTLDEEDAGHPMAMSSATPAGSSLADWFATALQAVDGRVIRVPHAEAARMAVLDQLQSWEVERVFMAQMARLIDLELPDWLRAAGLIVAGQTGSGAIDGDTAGAETVRAFLANAADAGLTGADLAIAETGTLVLAAAPGHPRMASALPPRHIAVIRATQIVPTLADVVPKLKERFLQADGTWSTSCVSLITGPSRTADIEQTLTIGVHGPRELTVVIIDEG